MKNRIKYADEPLGSLMVVRDFLPSPEQLVLKDEKVKITISLSKTSLEYFKEQAEQYHTAYQRMIHNLLDAYAMQNMKMKPQTRSPKRVSRQ